MLPVSFEQPCVERRVVKGFSARCLKLVETSKALAHDLGAGRHTGITGNAGTEKERGRSGRLSERYGQRDNRIQWHSARLDETRL